MDLHTVVGRMVGVARVLIVVAIVALTVYCIVELAQSPKYQVRHMPKWLWGFAIIFLPGLGGLLWLFNGRPLPTPRAPRRDQGPDGDEDFLRGL